VKKIEFTPLIKKGTFSNSDELATILSEIDTAISLIVWPPGADSFTINPGKHLNGVKPIKENFVSHLRSIGWEIENRVDVGVTTRRPGPIDATRLTESGKLFAVEWETGNISSSHRALNKIVAGIINGFLVGGALILPSGNIYPYLTDRVGNYPELEPYFCVWRSVNIPTGYLCTISVEHDNVNNNIAAIPKGTDGRALR